MRRFLGATHTLTQGFPGCVALAWHCIACSDLKTVEDAERRNLAVYFDSTTRYINGLLLSSLSRLYRRDTFTVFLAR